MFSVHHSSMRIPKTLIDLVVLPQDEAEKRQSGPDEHVISILGTSSYWPEPEFSQDAYPLGITRLRIDDIGDRLSSEQLQNLKKSFFAVLKVVDELRALKKPVTLVIHCLAGRSRSAAFAVGILGYLLKDDVEVLTQALNQLNAEFRQANRPFQPNPLFLKNFEKWMGMEREILTLICRRISVFFESWERHWKDNKS
jgi:predicted protein tyrosine phosphatase